MARIRASKNEYILKIDKFLGVNECPDGDTNIRVGEASTMTNFKITSDYNLQKRPGTQNVANLLFNYDIDVGDEVTLQTEINQPTATYMLYPNMNISDGGILYLLGTPVEATAANASSYVDYYWTNPAGVIYKLKECAYADH